MPAAVRVCGFAWVSVGDDVYHECTVVDPGHDVHRCGDDGCSVTSPVATKGGRRRNHHTQATT